MTMEYQLNKSTPGDEVVVAGSARPADGTYVGVVEGTAIARDFKICKDGVVCASWSAGLYVGDRTTYYFNSSCFDTQPEKPSVTVVE